MTKTAEQVVAEALVGTLLTGSRELSPEQREDVVAIVVAALREAGMLAETGWDYARGVLIDSKMLVVGSGLPSEQVVNVRRRRAGEWEEMPNE